MEGVGNARSSDPPQRGLVELVAAMLSQEERKALVLRHTRHLEDSQIARSLGLNRAAAVNLLTQAEAKVRAAQRALIEAFVETNGGKGKAAANAQQPEHPKRAALATR